MLHEVAFYFAATTTLIAAIAAMTLRNLVHCAVCAAAAFASLGAIYLLLGAEFVGFSQLLVYVGAVAILIVFAVLLTRGDEVGPRDSQTPFSWLAGAAVAAFVLLGIALPIFSSASLQRRAPFEAGAPVKQIGEQLMTRYVLPLEMVGVLLTGALLGAVVIAMREESGVKIQSRRQAPRHVAPEEAISLQ